MESEDDDDGGDNDADNHTSSGSESSEEDREIDETDGTHCIFNFYVVMFSFSVQEPY